MHVDAVETARMAIYLNAVVAGHSIGTFWGDGARFVSAPGGRVVGRDPLEWLASLKDCRGFSVRMRSDQQNSKLPIWFRASHWVLRAHHGAGSSAWRPSYDIRDNPGSARRLWLVSYHPVDGEDALIPRRNVAEIAAQLSAILQSLITLTGERIRGWQDTFVRLLAMLEGRSAIPLDPPLPNDVLADLPRRLIGTIFAAHVFTGMGNWGDNEYGRDIQPEVDRLTQALFLLLAEGLPTAVETTLPKAR